MSTFENGVTAKRVDNYKKLITRNNHCKPEGWNDALPYKEVPGPKPIPILGNMWRFLPYVGNYYNVPLQKFYKMLQDQYGNVVCLKGIIGRKPLIIVFDPDDMKTFLKNAGPFPIRNFMESYVYYRTHIRQDVFQGLGGLTSVHGEEWFKFRTLVNPILTHYNATERYIDPMDKIACELVENMHNFSIQNENNEMPDDFTNELYKWALESIGIIAFNKYLGCLNLNLEEGSETQKLTSYVVETFDLMYYLDVLPPIWKIISTPSWKEYVKRLDFITSLVQKYIEEALANGIDDNIPDDELSVTQRLAKIDTKVATAIAMDMLTAGIDTTGRTLGAILYFLARNPEKQDRLREEVLKNLPEKNCAVTKDTLKASPYLKAVIKEGTRIAPVAVGTLRTTVSELVLGGYRIPKNTDVLSMNLISANSEEFKDPEKFIPERWLRTEDSEYSCANVHPFATLPFGFGPRSCVGKRFANLQLEVALAKIIRNFELSWPHEDMVFTAKFLYGVASPLKLKVCPLEE